MQDKELNLHEYDKLCSSKAETDNKMTFNMLGLAQLRRASVRCMTTRSSQSTNFDLDGSPQFYKTCHQRDDRQCTSDHSAVSWESVSLDSAVNGRCAERIHTGSRELATGTLHCMTLHLNTTSEGVQERASSTRAPTWEQDSALSMDLDE